MVLQAEDRQFGLVVDGINDTQEIVVKPLGKQLKGLSVYAGATIMGDGRVALILDVLGIGQRSGVLAESREQARAAAEQQPHSASETAAAASVPGRFVPAAGRSAVSGRQAGRVPAVGHRACRRGPGGAIPEPHPPPGAASGSPRFRRARRPRNSRIPPIPVQVIVFNDGERSLGVVVDQILDIAEDAVTVRRQSSRKGLLGSAVVGHEVADFLDIEYVIRGAAADWFPATGESAETALVWAGKVCAGKDC